MSDKANGILVLIAFIVFFGGIGISIKTFYGPENPFLWLGPGGCLPYLFTGAAFLTLLALFTILFNTFGHYELGGWGQWAKGQIIVWGLVAFLFCWLALKTGESGYGFMYCNNEYCYTHSPSKEIGTSMKLRATRNQIDTFIVCPQCGETNKVFDYWW